MSVIIREMTPKEYEIFYRWSVEHHAAELTQEEYLNPEEAIRETKKEVASMLPYGRDTKDHHFWTIEEARSGETAGFIWTIYEKTNGRKQCFLCDFAVWESKRRRGYGTEALRLAEKKAKADGCLECVLFVADRNTAADALYRHSGYVFLRREGYGEYRIKRLYQP